MTRLPLASLSWQFRDATTDGAWLPATVPGCVHRDLRRAGLIPDPFWGANELELQWIEERTWEYRTRFDLPETLRGEPVVELCADGLDTVSVVSLNGHEIARTENMFLAYRWDVGPRLRARDNELCIRFEPAMDYVRTRRLEHAPREINDPVGGCTRLRKEQCQFGWDWGPRFVTAGIWQDLRLEGGPPNRLEGVRLTQEHREGAVRLALVPETRAPLAAPEVRWKLSLDGETVVEGTGTSLEVPAPQLWWPNGQGPQPLYTLRVEVCDGDTPLGTWERRLGLRTIALDHSPDAHGEAFRFLVNGRPIFAKGANWIPAHSFVAGLTRADYARDLEAAAAVHMNMIRVWGGGIYESEDFYDLCDELGLLVWQDFMFSCTLYPGDDAFAASVREEARCQTRRLRHRACLALWCGNNEIPMINHEDLVAHRAYQEAYDRIFHDVLPAVVAAEDPATAYWPSSPYRHGANERAHPPGERGGDTHFWDVWHARHPVSDYQKWRFRFVSEFGMQAFCSPETQATFCPPEDANVFGATMENHQKNRAGNQIILDYVSRRYRFPKSQDDLLYLSQLNQAYCLETGVEFYRRISPHCMGALYWQLNDCWPVASWSSIEFTGRWRALHYAARRFFAPTLVTAQLLGEDTVTIGNYRRVSYHAVELYTVSDLPDPTPARLFWDLFHLDGRKLLEGGKSVTLEPVGGRLQASVELAEALAVHPRETVYLRIGLEAAGQPRQEETVFLTRPRFLDLPKCTVTVAATARDPRTVELRLRAPCFQHRLSLEWPGRAFHASDNFFELYPDEEKTVLLHFAEPATPAEIEANVRTRSLADTY
jgi:beta-mannosidase